MTIIPPDGYNSGDRLSKRAQEWLAWYGNKNNIRVEHGRNEKNTKLESIRLSIYI